MLWKGTKAKSSWCGCCWLLFASCIGLQGLLVKILQHWTSKIVTDLSYLLQNSVHIMSTDYIHINPWSAADFHAVYHGKKWEPFSADPWYSQHYSKNVMSDSGLQDIQQGRSMSIRRHDLIHNSWHVPSQEFFLSMMRCVDRYLFDLGTSTFDTSLQFLTTRFRQVRAHLFVGPFKSIRRSEMRFM